MKLNQKLSLWFLGMALCVGAISFAWVHRAQAVRARLDVFANRTTPALVALGQMKSSSLEMLATVYRATAAEAPRSAQPDAAMSQRPTADDPIQQSHTRYAEWLAVYQGVTKDAAVSVSFAPVERTAATLYEHSRELLRLHQQGVGQTELAARRQALHETEEQFVKSIDKVMAAQIVLLKRQQREVSRGVERAIRWSIVTAGVLGLLAVLLGVWVADTLARPIIRLAGDVKAVGQGDFTRRTTVKSSDEIGALAKSFNWMAQHLEQTTVSKRYVDKIITSMADMLIVVRPDGTIQSVNQATLRLLGYAESELVGQPLARFFASAHPDGGLEHVREQDIVTNRETTYVAKDGRTIPVLLSAATMRDEEGRLEGIVCVALDITERKRAEEALKQAYAELQRAQQQLVQSEKLAALGRFAAGVAHEVKNPLSIILGGIEYLEKKFSAADEDTTTSLRMIEHSVQRADTIVRDLLKFARPSSLQKERVSPQELVDATLSLLTHSGSLKQVAVERRFTADVTVVEVDKNQVQQVLLNLMMNAIDAMPSGGTLRVSTARGATEAQPSCRIDIADTGEGIAPEHLAKLFEPFFTTKRDKKGTGLGLSISKTIVESHGGTLTLASMRGAGTTATVTLPANTKGVRA